MQSIVSRLFFVYGGCCLYVWVALQNCSNGCNATLWHNMFFYITNCLHEQGTAARRITNKKVGKQKFCIENLLPDFNL